MPKPLEHLLHFLGVMVLAPSSQCGFIAGDTGPIVSESPWRQCITIVGWLLLSVVSLYRSLLV